MLDHKQILDIIPHRDPFVFVDKIIELDPGKKVVGIKQVTNREDFFKGHFPEEPVMPGVLIIEALAQVGCVGLMCLEEFKGKKGYFTGIDKAKFRRKVVPGDTLHLQMTITKRKGPMGVGEARATVDGELAAEAVLTFFVG